MESGAGDATSFFSGNLLVLPKYLCLEPDAPCQHSSNDTRALRTDRFQNAAHLEGETVWVLAPAPGAVCRDSFPCLRSQSLFVCLCCQSRSQLCNPVQPTAAAAAAAGAAD
ncbi:unnamed protein product [Pleuronectes platessa]|uniref:Uncharacterized protein n=1 Tax=Pleuronectes platessa TaxID=8262 RepID=A0A9N7UG64_PLEPL|nr:unnamed protein product [Pleuronectes platessa]